MGLNEQLPFYSHTPHDTKSALGSRGRDTNKAYLKADKVSKSERTRKVEYTYHFYRAMCMHSRGKIYVCLSRAGIVCKRLYISSKFFHHRVALPF